MDPHLRFKYVDMGQEVRKMLLMAPMFGGEDSEGSSPAQTPLQAARDANPRRAGEYPEGSAPAQTPRPAAPDVKPRRAGELRERPTPYSKSTNADKHYVDRYRERIIADTSNVMSILEQLRCKELVTSEKYSEVKAEKTAPAQMRVLYDCMRSWGPADKEHFLDALLEFERPLIRKLLTE